MNFLQTIFENLSKSADKPILHEVTEGKLRTTTCQQFLDQICQTRQALKQSGLKPGDRCALLAPNSSRWVAVDLAIMAEGGIAVPLYSRQAASEVVTMMQDSTPSLLICGDEELRQSILTVWPEAPATLLYEEIFRGPSNEESSRPLPLPDDSPVTIIYTSGTSGNAKGVVLNVGNISFMVRRTTTRLEELMAGVVKERDDRVFHYLPFCFAGSWMLLLTCLYRNNALMISTDLNRLADELKVAKPHYFLNVPALLDRIRNGVRGELQKKGGLALTLFEKGQAAWLRKRLGKQHRWDGVWRALAGTLVFPKIKQKIGLNLRALVSGSAPLSEETHLFFQMIGIPVLQVYGLTETTAICTMDDVYDYTPGRVGPAIPGIEMKVGPDNEILVRGPNVFPGYWNRPEATAEVIREGWFHTGDQGEINERGNWRVVGRLKNLIIPSSGHNISPEPIEQMILTELSDTEQAILVGNGRKFLSVIVTGNIPTDRITKALDKVNLGLPHYKQVRKFHLSPESFTVENGLLTANRKMKRSVIETRYKREIDALYQVDQ